MSYPYSSPEEIIEAIKASEDMKPIAEASGLDILDLEDAKAATEEGIEPLTIITPYFVAEAKLKVESAKYNLNMQASILQDWIEYTKKIALESEDVARKICDKSKNLDDCLAKLIEYSFTNAFAIPPEIAKKAIPNAPGKITLGIPNMLEAKRIITAYYTE